jgi:hypothetical protein
MSRTDVKRTLRMAGRNCSVGRFAHPEDGCSGRTGVQAKANIALRARNSLRQPKQTPADARADCLGSITSVRRRMKEAQAVPLQLEFAYYQERLAVLTGASHSPVSRSSSNVIVIEQPAMSREVTSEPVRYRETTIPRPVSMRRAALTIK